MTVRQLKAINTVGGTANFSILIICELEDAKTVQETLVKCGIPIGFVHAKTPITATCPNSKKNIYSSACNANFDTCIGTTNNELIQYMQRFSFFA